MDYGNILSRAWQIIWRHKALWIFGILAGCTQAAGSGGSNSGIRFSSGRTGAEISRWFENVDPNIWAIVAIVAVLLILLFGLVAIFLGTVGTIGLVRGTLQAEAGAQRLSFSELFSGSMPYFWRVLGLNVLAFLVLLVVFPLVGIPLGLCTCGLGVVALGLFVAVFLELANISIVSENLGIVDALGRSWQLIRDNFGPVLVMVLILNVLIKAIAGFIIGLPLLLVLGPIIAGVTAQALTGSEVGIPGGLLVAALIFLAYLPVLLLLSGILRAFLSSAWTLTALRLRGRSVEAVQPLGPA